MDKGHKWRDHIVSAYKVEPGTTPIDPRQVLVKHPMETAGLTQLLKQEADQKTGNEPHQAATDSTSPHADQNA